MEKTLDTQTCFMPQDGCSIPGIISSKTVSKTEKWGKKANGPVLCLSGGKCSHSLPLKFPECHGELRTLSTYSACVYRTISSFSLETRFGNRTTRHSYILYNLNGGEHICVYTYTHKQFNRSMRQNLTIVYMLKQSLGQRATRQTCEILCFAGGWEELHVCF